MLALASAGGLLNIQNIIMWRRRGTIPGGEACIRVAGISDCLIQPSLIETAWTSKDVSFDGPLRRKLVDERRAARRNMNIIYSASLDESYRMRKPNLDMLSSYRKRPAQSTICIFGALCAVYRLVADSPRDHSSSQKPHETG